MLRLLLLVKLGRMVEIFNSENVRPPPLFFFSRGFGLGSSESCVVEQILAGGLLLRDFHQVEKFLYHPQFVHSCYKMWVF